jgi:hypothetical protein
MFYSTVILLLVVCVIFTTTLLNIVMRSEVTLWFVFVSLSGFFSVAPRPNAGHDLIVEVSRSHTVMHHSRRTPLDEWSARRRDLYLTTHNTQTNIHAPAGFDTTISLVKTYALDRAATGTGTRQTSDYFWNSVLNYDAPWKTVRGDFLLPFDHKVI